MDFLLFFLLQFRLLLDKNLVFGADLGCRLEDYFRRKWIKCLISCGIWMPTQKSMRISITVHFPVVLLRSFPPPSCSYSSSPSSVRVSYFVWKIFVWIFFFFWSWHRNIDIILLIDSISTGIVWLHVKIGYIFFIIPNGEFICWFTWNSVHFSTI